METKQLTVNVAPSSDEGHYVKGARKVVDIEMDITESFVVEGKSTLETKNHTSIDLEEDCLINTQVVFNPFSKMYEKVVD